MSGDADWRSVLTASERYDNVQKLTRAVAAAGLGQSAFAIENEAYQTARTRDEYDAQCALATPAPTTEPPSHLPDPLDHGPDDAGAGPGITIGSYQNCRYIASGVTSEVYRSQARALKVIVETHNIEPHSPHREVKILKSLRDADAPNIIRLLETFHDRDQRLVLVFPYLPRTLSHLISHPGSRALLTPPLLRTVFTSLFRALRHLHSQGIIHRDVKPSALLLAAPGPSSPSQVQLSDFGTAWHPAHSAASEPADRKVLDVGTGPYRAPETLFGNRAYGTGVDLWAAGATLAECLLGLGGAAGSGSSSSGRDDDDDDHHHHHHDNKNNNANKSKTLFESRPAHEDGNQLGLILSIFQTLGTPTPETWPEAVGFRTPPFGMYRVFEGRVARQGWEGVLPGVAEEWRALVKGLVRYESSQRVTAAEALNFPCLRGQSKEECEEEDVQSVRNRGWQEQEELGHHTRG